MSSDSMSAAWSPSSASDVSSDDSKNDPIAIVGMACRLPGGVNDTSDFWEMLMEGRTGQCEVPASRFNIDSFHQLHGADAPGGVNHRGGYYIKDDVRLFDHEFFGILKTEAAAMDPQQRKLLEVVFECLEVAGITLDDISGSDTGCYVGNFAYDFAVMQMKDSEYLSRHAATGMGSTILSNRLSHVFDLRGPSLTIDTACSSSLYCLHSACAAIENGDCSAAIVAGANLIQSVEQSIGMMKAGVLSDTSACNTFTDIANGYARADGIGALYLKRLSDARRDGDPIRAIIRATAVGANGRTAGISAPSPNAQEHLIRKAYQRAGIESTETTYVECHGTGTKAGDSGEVTALSRVFEREQNNALLIGSVKTNVGHSEAVSGLSGIIKTVLAIEHGVIPPSVIAGRIASGIQQLEPSLQVVREAIAWPDRTPRRAGVNSFGYGGANGHVILESAPTTTRSQGLTMSTSSNKSFLLPFSAASITALEQRVTEMSAMNIRDEQLGDLAYTLGCRRTHFPARGFLLANSVKDMSLDSLKMTPTGAFPKQVCFVFTGQGAQWPQMGADILPKSPIFRASLRHMDAVLQLLPDAPKWTLEASILEDPSRSRMHEAKIAQPAATALQVALVDMLASWNIFPHMVVGHSSGEIAAAYAAGNINAEEAIVSAYYRGLLNDQNEMKGAMMAVGLSQDESDTELQRCQAHCSVKVACVNSSSSTTWSGDEDVIDRLLVNLTERGIFARKLKTGGKAYHSHHMKPLGPQLETLIPIGLKHISTARRSRTLNCRFMSTVTGLYKTAEFNPTYWRANMESPVLFLQAVQKIMKEQNFHYVEVGPHSALALPLKQIRTELGIADENGPYSTVLTRGEDSMRCALNLAGRLFTHGLQPSFESINSEVAGITSRQVMINLPRYPWQYQEPLWLESRISSEFRNRPYPYHELLGSWVPGGDGISNSWRNRLQTKHVPWLSGHQLEDSVIFPAAGYIAMAIEAAMQATHQSRDKVPSIGLRQIRISKALILPRDSGDVELFTTLHSSSGNAWYFFEVVSFSKGNSSVHASGQVTTSAASNILSSERKEGVCLTKPTAWYARFADVGMGFAKDFQSLDGISTKCGSAHASTRMLTSLNSQPSYGSSYLIHPVTLDAMLQLGIIAKTNGTKNNLSGNVPVAIEEVSIRSSRIPHALEACRVLADTTEDAVGAIEVTAELRDPDQAPFAQFRGVKMAPFAPSTLATSKATRQPITKLSWKPDVLFNVHEGMLTNVTDCARSLLDLILHKRPGLRILELEDSSVRQKDHVIGRISSTGSLSVALNDKEFEDAGEAVFDVMLIPKHRNQTLQAIQSSFSEHLSSDGMLIAMLSLMEIEQLQNFGLKTQYNTTAHGGYHLTLATQDQSTESHQVIIAMPSNPSLNLEHLVSDIRAQVQGESKVLLLNEMSTSTIPAGATVISLIESEQPYFADASDAELEATRPLIERADKVIWVTRGGLLEGVVPEYSVSSGIARSVRLEHPSLKFVTLDLEMSALSHPRTASNIASALRTSETELCQKDGLIHICRFLIDEPLNRQFLQMEGSRLVEKTLGEAGGCTLRLGSNASFESAYFVADHETSVPNDSVHIKIDSTLLDATTLRSLSSKNTDKARPVGFDSRGIVLKVGNNVQGISIGDHVATLTPGNLCTQAIVPSWACVKLHQADTFRGISHFATALYGLRYQAKMSAGDVVLITDGMSALGQAAVQIAKLLKAQLFVTVKSYAEARQLRKLYALRAHNVLVTHGSPLTKDTRQSIAGGLGASVLFVSSTDDVADVFPVCGDLGHVVAPTLDDSSLPKITSAALRHGITISAADLYRLYTYGSTNALYKGILEQVVTLLRSNSLRTIQKVKTFDVSALTDAVSTCTLTSSVGAVNVSFADSTSMIKFQMPRHMTTFKSDQSYLLVGCLGGLGRTLSTWMLSRGARHFTFLGRTGDDGDYARDLIHDLVTLGAHVKVVRGDVGQLADVQAAVAASEMPTAGVVHAAMGLDESLFTRMSARSLQKALGPKLLGARNLHTALEGVQLDFMLLTSSVSGSVGVAAQANYCAANAFLDSFALHLRTHGNVPATSVGLSMISDAGFLAENPQAAALMARTGIAPLDSDDVLRIIDIALQSGKHHILTGLDVGHFAQARERQKTAVFPAADDLRTVHLLPAVDQGMENNDGPANALPLDVTRAMTQGLSLGDAVQECVACQLAQLLQVRRERLDLTKPLSAYGLDSMLATELRGWLWTSFGTNITFLELLADTATAHGLAASVWNGLAEMND